MKRKFIALAGCLALIICFAFCADAAGDLPYNDGVFTVTEPDEGYFEEYGDSTEIPFYGEDGDYYYDYDGDDYFDDDPEISERAEKFLYIAVASVLLFVPLVIVAVVLIVKNRKVSNKLSEYEKRIKPAVMYYDPTGKVQSVNYYGQSPFSQGNGYQPPYSQPYNPQYGQPGANGYASQYNAGTYNGESGVNGNE